MQVANMNNLCVVSRVGVKPSLHNLGLGQMIVKYVIEDVEKRGYDGIIMLVSKTNPSAIAMYEKLKFNWCGESRMYDNDWFIYKMLFKDSKSL
jgi:ribosomal protein S18 acetylase RimI-like enzyme